jgi:hypothetical protein
MSNGRRVLLCHLSCLQELALDPRALEQGVVNPADLDTVEPTRNRLHGGRGTLGTRSVSTRIARATSIHEQAVSPRLRAGQSVRRRLSRQSPHRDENPDLA